MAKFPRPIPGKDKWELKDGTVISGTDYAAWQTGTVQGGPAALPDYEIKPGGVINVNGIDELKKFEFKADWKIEDARKEFEKLLDEVADKEPKSATDKWIEQWEKDNA